MKNIHLLPTNKPSRLFLNKVNNKLLIDNDCTLKEVLPSSLYQNIYITSNEAIKEVDWCLDKFNQIWKLEDGKLIGFDNKGIKRFSTDNILGHECKKIILTDNKDLIADGVQAIDDEFLEWFVKNPSCEFVEVEKGYAFGTFYKIIIPIEIDILELGQIIPIEEPKQRLEKYSERFNKDLSVKENISTWGKRIVEEPKQETLEEAYNKIYKEIDFSEFDFASFAIGAKWQAERSYSKEEVENIIQKLMYDVHCGDICEGDKIIDFKISPRKWFGQFKKK